MEGDRDELPFCGDALEVRIELAVAAHGDDGCAALRLRVPARKAIAVIAVFVLAHLAVLQRPRDRCVQSQIVIGNRLAVRHVLDLIQIAIFDAVRRGRRGGTQAVPRARVRGNERRIVLRRSVGKLAVDVCGERIRSADHFQDRFDLGTRLRLIVLFLPCRGKFGQSDQAARQLRECAVDSGDLQHAVSGRKLHGEILLPIFDLVVFRVGRAEHDADGAALALFKAQRHDDLRIELLADARKRCGAVVGRERAIDVLRHLARQQPPAGIERRVGIDLRNGSIHGIFAGFVIIPAREREVGARGRRERDGVARIADRIARRTAHAVQRDGTVFARPLCIERDVLRRRKVCGIDLVLQPAVVIPALERMVLVDGSRKRERSRDPLHGRAGSAAVAFERDRDRSPIGKLRKVGAVRRTADPEACSLISGKGRVVVEGVSERAVDINFELIAVVGNGELRRDLGLRIVIFLLPAFGKRSKGHDAAGHLRPLPFRHRTDLQSAVSGSKLRGKIVAPRLKRIIDIGKRHAEGDARRAARALCKGDLRGIQPDLLFFVQKDPRNFPRRGIGAVAVVRQILLGRDLRFIVIGKEQNVFLSEDDLGPFDRGPVLIHPTGKGTLRPLHGDRIGRKQFGNADGIALEIGTAFDFEAVHPVIEIQIDARRPFCIERDVGNGDISRRRNRFARQFLVREPAVKDVIVAEGFGQRKRLPRILHRVLFRAAVGHKRDGVFRIFAAGLFRIARFLLPLLLIVRLIAAVVSRAAARKNEGGEQDAEQQYKPSSEASFHAVFPPFIHTDIHW